MPDSDSVRYGRSVASLQQDLQNKVAKIHSLTETIQLIRGKASDPTIIALCDATLEKQS